MTLSTKKLGIIALIAILFALFIRTSVLETFRIPTKAMVPSLQPGDIAVVNKVAYGFRLPFFDSYLFEWANVQVGDIVVFPLPDDPDRLFVKRVAAIGGDEVEITDEGFLQVNEKKIRFGSWAERNDLTSMKSVKIPEGRLFLVGDQVDTGTDSRNWGTVVANTVIGKVSWILSQGWFKTPDERKKPLASLERP